MERGERLDAQLARRITESPLSLTVHFAPVRAVASGSSPGGSPVSPFTRTAPTPSVIESPVTPVSAPVTMPCLWYASYSSVGGSNRRNDMLRETVAWAANADAIARVLLEDAGVTAFENFGKNVFLRADHVEYQGARYAVVGCVPMGSGWRPALTLHVGLKSDVGG